MASFPVHFQLSNFSLQVEKSSIQVFTSFCNKVIKKKIILKFHSVWV